MSNERSSLNDATALFIHQEEGWDGTCSIATVKRSDRTITQAVIAQKMQQADAVFIVDALQRARDLACLAMLVVRMKERLAGAPEAALLADISAEFERVLARPAPKIGEPIVLVSADLPSLDPVEHAEPNVEGMAP